MNLRKRAGHKEEDTTKKILLNGIIILLTSFLATQGFGHSPGIKDSKLDSPKGESVYNLDNKWVTQEGSTIKLSHLRGRPVVLAMIYTSCKDVCPLIVSDMKRIEKALLSRPEIKVQFVLVSIDPARDTPQNLKQFSAAHNLDLKKWTLLSSKEKEVLELSVVLGVNFAKIKNGDFEHSNLITVLDPDGIIKHRQVGLGQDPTESLKTIYSFGKL